MSLDLLAKKIILLRLRGMLLCSVLLYWPFYWMYLAINPTFQESLTQRLFLSSLAGLLLLCTYKKGLNVRSLIWPLNVLLLSHVFHFAYLCHLNSWNEYYRFGYLATAIAAGSAAFRFKDYVFISLAILALPWISYLFHPMDSLPLLLMSAAIFAVFFILGITAKINYRYQKQIIKLSMGMIENSKMAALGQMASGMAHEINNPLAIIKSRAEQLLFVLMSSGEVSSDTFKKELAKISNTTDRIAKIIKGLRAFARSSETDPFVLTKFKSVYENTLELCNEKIKNRSIDILLEAHADFSILCRESQMIQVMLNLLNNSVDAIDGLEKKWIKISTAENENFYIIKVTDSGSGIPSDVAHKVMQPFFTTKEVGKGTGLGLSISKGILEEHGAQIHYDIDSRNTSFQIDFPKKNKDSISAVA